MICMGDATMTHKRCSWASVDGPLLLQYHDREWVSLFIVTANISRSSCSQAHRPD